MRASHSFSLGPYSAALHFVELFLSQKVKVIEPCDSKSYYLHTLAENLHYYIVTSRAYVPSTNRVLLSPLLLSKRTKKWTLTVAQNK